MFGVRASIINALKMPNAFSFTDVSNASTNTTYTSNTVSVTGLAPGTTVIVSATGGTVDAGASSLSGTFASSKTVSATGSGTIVIAARLTSSGSGGTATNCTVSINGRSDIYTVTTTSVSAPTITLYSTITATTGPSTSFNVGTYSGTVDSYTVNSGPTSGTYTFSGGIISYNGSLTTGYNGSTLSLTATNSGGSNTSSGTMSVTEMTPTFTLTDWTFPVGQTIATFNPPRKTVATSTAGIPNGSVNSGSLPPGTSLLFNQGGNGDVIITGTPSSTGVYSFTLACSSNYYSGNAITGTINITIN